MNLIWADWPAPPNIKALCTTRQGGVSSAPFDQLNLGDHVGDDPQAVLDNRQSLLNSLSLVKPAQWLKQVHGVEVVEAYSDQQIREADACYTTEPGVACVIMTADCLPVLFTNRSGSKAAAAHAGWRGLAEGVLEQTLSQFDDPSEVMVWMGPAIGPDAFEVGQEVYDRFVDDLAQSRDAFKLSPSHHERWVADIYQLARLRLNRAGVRQIFGGGLCTYTDSERFFSYRRQAQTGRMASLIWIEDDE
ncbi:MULTISPECIES: peptidoglycan editing factor PgeF [unclassified Marinobacterium]|jgi:polyphenol oxidase|uniref:peptidoglycan editing factor PgeF n=1 Tax=unclassified Marinobacterium TaxID=2644139 RepID=UPI001567F93F|nr:MULTISPECIES: peptidoglycan editing factor PgeF [unclassified Marinobacterium]NRP53340.1 Laccase domain protein YfiH [Marinobacterium sp. xm-v-242]NRP60026.1 Laccase domain protein YfiH [Marinobacterium sp. xm-d-564]NRP78125.1 Laccase domain protein YfiH [Marinobacterium sp. xm-m-383]NRP95315.1 Laccase domain protein YfiH [Marinobacterium sp. xm-g-59]